MRLVYLDEAGIGNPKHEPTVVVAGVIVHGDEKLDRVKRHLKALVKKHIPEDCREGFICHAKEIFNGGGKVFDRKAPRLTDDERWALADDLAAIPAKFDLPIVVGWEERARICSEYGFPDSLSQHERTVAAHAVSFLFASSMVEAWMRKHGKYENCLLIVENNKAAREVLLRVQQANQDERILAQLDDKARKMLPLTKIQEDPLFQEKRPANPLEVADFCAYIWKRFVTKQTDPFWQRFLDPMRGHFVTI